LREEFTRFGELEKVDLIADKRTGQSRCFAFIYFEKIEDATKAKETCNGMRLHGRNIRIDFSLTKKAHEPTPGQYMGKARRDGGRRYDRYGPRGYSPRRRSPPRRDRYDPYDDRYGDRYGSRDRHDDRYGGSDRYGSYDRERYY